MNAPNNPPEWWALHLRKARGETLTADEQQRYEAEIARQDKEAPPLKNDLHALKLLREQVAKLKTENDSLRAQIAELEREQEKIERSLSKEVRHLLGVGE